MKDPHSYPFYYTIAIRLLLLTLILFLLVTGRELFLPLTIAVFASFILLPVSVFLERFHIPHAIAVFISILFAIVLLCAFVFFLYTQIQSFASDFADLKIKFDEKISSIQQYIYVQFHISRSDQTKWLDNKIASFMDQGDRFLIVFLTASATFITNLILITLYIYFLTIYRDKIKKFISLVSNDEHQQVYIIINKVFVVAQKYLKGLMLDMTIVAIILSIGFTLLEVKHAILFGLLVAVCNIILPYMGITIGSIFPFFMIMITQDHFGPAAGVIGFCAAMQFIDNHFINPYVVGFSVSINPLTAFLALVASAMIWGIYGMLLCIPVMGMIKVICDHVEPLKPYGYIIGQESEFGQDMEKKKKRIANKLIGKKKNTA